MSFGHIRTLWSQNQSCMCRAAPLPHIKANRLGRGISSGGAGTRTGNASACSLLAMADERPATEKFLKWLNSKDGASAGLMNSFLFEDRCALPDQISFVPAFPWRGFLVAVKGRDRAH
jgi:hypothetical protein